MASTPIPVMTSAMPPTTTPTVAAAVASPRWPGAREWCPRPRAPVRDAAGIDRLVVIGDGLYAVGRSPASRPYTPRGMPYELPPDPRTERRTRLTRWVGFAFAVVLVALVAYFAYVGYEGSRQLTDPPTPTADCRTPATMGWAYEAINYDIATDAELATEADPTECTRQGAPAGDAVTVGNIGLAGWYIPAGNGAAPTAPTVVMAHGWGSNKSNMLDRAAILHDDYNLLLLDLRNHGQSSDGANHAGRARGR